MRKRKRVPDHFLNVVKIYLRFLSRGFFYQAVGQRGLESYYKITLEKKSEKVTSSWLPFSILL